MELLDAEVQAAKVLGSFQGAQRVEVSQDRQSLKEHLLSVVVLLFIVLHLLSPVLPQKDKISQNNQITCTTWPSVQESGPTVKP